MGPDPWDSYAGATAEWPTGPSVVYGTTGGMGPRPDRNLVGSAIQLPPASGTATKAVKTTKMPFAHQGP